MGDFTNGSDNFTNAIKGLKTFDGRTPATFRDWHKNLVVVLGVTHRGFVNLIKGQLRPTEETTSTGISPALDGFDRANENLYAILHLLTEKPVSLLVLKHEGGCGISGDGLKALKELVGK